MGKRDVQKLFEKQISTGKARWHVRTRSTAQEMSDDYAESLRREKERERRERFGTDQHSFKSFSNSSPAHALLEDNEQLERMLKGGVRSDMAFIISGEKLAESPDQLVNQNKPDKGLKNGSCNITACQKPGATFKNRGNQKYYCSDCAREINWPGGRNDTFKLYGTYLLCEHED
jgi:hypothetical protein